LYSRGDIRNANGANVLSLGDIDVAVDGTRGADGLLVNRANSVTNDQSSVEASRNVEVATNTLNSTRPAPMVETVTADSRGGQRDERRRQYWPQRRGRHDGALGAERHRECFRMHRRQSRGAPGGQKPRAADADWRAMHDRNAYCKPTPTIINRPTAPTAPCCAPPTPSTHPLFSS
jgi:hypothetical protein